MQRGGTRSREPPMPKPTPDAPQDYPRLLEAEIASLLVKRGFNAEGARYWARQIAVYGHSQAKDKLAILFYDLATQAEVNLGNRQVMDQVFQNLH